MRRLSSLFAAAALAACFASPVAADDAKIRVVIIDGQNNHNWKQTTPYLKKTLEQCGRFTVNVSSNVKAGEKAPEGTVPFPPDLGKYDAV